MNGTAFILKKISYSDADLIIYVLSKSEGLLKFFVRGAKNSKKRFAGGVLEPPNLIQYEAHGSHSQQDTEKLITLKDANLLQGFENLRASYKSIETLYLLIKVVLLSEAGHEDLYNHFGASLKILPEIKDFTRFFTHFVVRYLYLEGVLPQVNEFLEYVKTPMGRHLSLKEVSKESVHREAALTSHILNTYSSAKSEIKWP